MLTLSLSNAPPTSEIAPEISHLSSADFATVSAATHQLSGSEQTQEPVAKLGWILVQKRWISAAQLQTILLQQSHQPPDCAQKLGELFVEQAMLSESQIKEALQEQYWRRHGYWVI